MLEGSDKMVCLGYFSNTNLCLHSKNLSLCSVHVQFRMDPYLMQCHTCGSLSHWIIILSLFFSRFSLENFSQYPERFSNLLFLRPPISLHLMIALVTEKRGRQWFFGTIYFGWRTFRVCFCGEAR